MFLRTLSILAILTTGSAALAEEPTTMPSTMPSAPATQPSNEMRVLVLPFAPVLKSDSDWVGRAVQQSLAADLSRPTNGRPLQGISDNTVATTTAEAIEAGQKAGVRYVVFGSYQLIEPNLKLTGEIVDVSTGQVIGGLKSTGSTRELFDMQDTIGMQVRWALGTEQLAAKKLPPQVAQAPAPVIPPQGPVQVGPSRYDGSDLARAVADDRSLIESRDAAGSSYRQSYYDDSNYGYGFNYNYGGLFYGGYGYRYGYGWPVVIVNPPSCFHPSRGSTPPSFIELRGSNRNFAVGYASSNGATRMTMQSTPRNFNTAPSNVMSSTGGNYVTGPIHANSPRR